MHIEERLRRQRLKWGFMQTEFAEPSPVCAGCGLGGYDGAQYC